MLTPQSQFVAVYMQHNDICVSIGPETELTSDLSPLSRTKDILVRNTKSSSTSNLHRRLTFKTRALHFIKHGGSYLHIKKELSLKPT